MSKSALEIAKAARAAFEASQLLTSEQRTNALLAVRDELERQKDAVLEANRRDMSAAEELVAAGKLSASLVKRLDLSSTEKWNSMLQGVSDVAKLADPTNKVTYATKLDDGLELYRVTCPIGVLLIIFEARPEVVVNIASLAIKSGNAAILKGGKESTESAKVLANCIRTALASSSVPEDYIQVVQTREEISELLEQDKYIDLVIPRGSNALVSHIQHSTRIPVMGHADGLCTVYLDASADSAKACRVAVDSKTNYPAACNSAEILVVHKDILESVWPRVADALVKAGVELRCDEPSLTSIKPSQDSDLIKPSISTDYDTEFLNLTMAVKAVASFDEAVAFINTHSSHHTDAIVTESQELARRFCRSVDSAGTFVNASTRFADGLRYGFGTEVGISTGRTHARGPVGLEGLVIYKYVLMSGGQDGHVVGEFGTGGRAYQHSPLAPSLPY
ncbi:related to glutamate-5-semialdehyde dehydrogenase [Serendipita indica DSM 11827]|uniref:glutamate-5-semialdehyde dehydrogenase n=1 Tax=Serendipita indica (strain DSM 11827) TaxID=1109443 RepID=G4T9A0_SERID|nr:related to glutamate-5-semialdehyde dehydrogenase [Serendipita indica DSM 11827]